MILTAYKLKEIAKIEGCTYCTAFNRKKKNKYVVVKFTSGKAGKSKNHTRYLHPDFSKILNEWTAFFTKI